MKKGNKEKGRPPAHAVTMTVRYFDEFWDEIESLRLDHAIECEVRSAVEIWLKERTLLRLGRIAMSALANAAFVTVEENINGV